MSEHYRLLPDLDLIISTAERDFPHWRRCSSSKLLLGLFGNVGAVFEFGTLLSKLHGKRQTGWHTTLLAVGLWQQFEDF